MAVVSLRVDRSEVQNDLARRVRNFLSKQGHPGLQDVNVEVAADVVHVRGKACNLYARELATTCCQRVAGVRRVVNEMVVSPNV